MDVPMTTKPSNFASDEVKAQSVIDYNADCDGYVHGIRSINITLSKFPVSSNSSYTECDWVIVGNYLEKVWIRFLKIDLPEPSVDGRCDIAYLTFGGYSNKGEKIIHKRLCGRVLPDIYLTPSSKAWMTFVWTGKGGVMPARPVIVKTEFTLKESGKLFNQMIAGIVCFLSLIIVSCLPILYYMRKSKQRMEFEIWGPVEEMKKLKWKQYFENILMEKENNAATSKRCKRFQSGSEARQSLHQRGDCSIISHYHRVKQQVAITEVGCERVSERLGETEAICEAVVHHPKLPCLEESNCHTKQNAAILQSILKNFPVQHSKDASNNAADEPLKVTAAEISTHLQGMATCRTAENDSLVQIPMEPRTPPPISNHPQGQRPLASICNEESFCAVASSSKILCSTPHLRGEVHNNDSDACKTSSPNQTSVTLSLEFGSYHPHTIDFSSRMSVDEGEKDGDEITRNAQQSYATNDEERRRSQRYQRQVTDEKMGPYDMLRSLPTEEKSSKSIKRRCNLMPLYCDQNSPCSISLSNRESDFTFVSSLTKSSDCEPEDGMKFDNALKYFPNHKHMSDKVFSESLQHVYERHKYLNNQNASFEQNDKLQRTRGEQDSNSPVIVDMQSPTAVSSSGSSGLARSSKNSAEFSRKQHQFNKSHSNFQMPICSHLLNYTMSSNNDPGINSESQTDAGSNKLHSRHFLCKTCSSCGYVDQSVSEAAHSLKYNMPSQDVRIGDTTMLMLPVLATPEENSSDVDRASFHTVFHHQSADMPIESHNPFSMLKYDLYHETML